MIEESRFNGNDADCVRTRWKLYVRNGLNACPMLHIERIGAVEEGVHAPYGKKEGGH